MQADALERALDGAARRLESARCRRNFTHVTDAEGAPLQAELDRIGIDPGDFLRTLVFVDGSGRRSCRASDAVAVTGVGSRVVYVCGRRFREAHARDAVRAQMFVLHELLHTLGLGENPPGTLEITRRVSARCRT
jgi:hypothetical protein